MPITLSHNQLAPPVCGVYIVHIDSGNINRKREGKMNKVLDRHIELVVAVNEAKTQIEHHAAADRLGGFREAIQLFDINYAQHLMECDIHYINQGIERPICCGVFLDWQPSE